MLRPLLFGLALTVVAGSGLNFLAIGDWGGTDVTPYYLPGEAANSHGMSSIASATNSSFVLALGDNFYYNGIQGDSTNFRFKSTFEEVFTEPALQIPWWVIAGNHDHLGNVTAQIAYTKISKRWRFNDYYYTFNYSFAPTNGVGRNTTLQIVYIDTVLLAGMPGHEEEHKFDPLPGPADEFVAETQWQWIEEQLNSSTADYLFVAGHYPVWSVCLHGPTEILVQRLRPMLEQYNVTAYISGHDHCQEFIDEGKGPFYILTGVGDMCCYAVDPVNELRIPRGSLKFHVAELNAPHGMTGGFASFAVTSTSAIATYRDQVGSPLFTTPPMRPRRRAHESSEEYQEQ